jgi:hypothetical protein
MGHVVHSSASGAQNVNALFFMLWWPGAVSIKSALGHVTPNLCFLIWWDLGSHSAFWCIRGTKRRRTIFPTWLGPVRFP